MTLLCRCSHSCSSRCCRGRGDGAVAERQRRSNSASASCWQLRRRVEAAVYAETAIKTLKHLGKYAPQSPVGDGQAAERLVGAGYRNKEALTVFIGIRLGCALLGVRVCSSPLLGRPNLFLALGGAALGYLLPEHGARPHGEEAAASDSPVAGRTRSICWS